MYIKLSLSIIFSLLVTYGQLAIGQLDQISNGLSPKDLQRLTTVISDVKKYYYRSIDDTTLVDRAISGMLASLDPHSEYLDANDLKELEISILGKLGGIGVEVVLDQGLIKVISPIDDTPAYRAGIKSGDYIVQINNKLVRDMSPRNSINMLRGKKGTQVNLTVIRKNENKPLMFNIRREIIRIKTVKERMLEPGYGYIRLAIFQDLTEKEMIRAIKRLQNSSKKFLRKKPQTGLKGLILDLRDNPGGLMMPAIQIADDFLDSSTLKDNDLIVYAKGQDDELKLTAKVTPGNLLPNVPIVVLINEGSASAAEVVAGALQDHRRAIVVGTRSFGKASVQELLPIDDSSAIKLTTALYYTPRGRLIQAKGLEPDITVENIQLSQSNTEELPIPRIDESSLLNHIKNHEDENSDDESEAKTLERQQKRSQAERALAYRDYQLYEALHILKSQNVTRQ